jgi:hypothetical protein
MATEVIDEWTVIDYHHQKINLRKSEVLAWNGLSRFDKRAMADRFKNLEKKKLIKFIEINGRMTCVKNLNYEARNGK